MAFNTRLWSYRGLIWNLGFVSSSLKLPLAVMLHATLLWLSSIVKYNFLSLIQWAAALPEAQAPHFSPWRAIGPHTEGRHKMCSCNSSSCGRLASRWCVWVQLWPKTCTDQLRQRPMLGGICQQTEPWMKTILEATDVSILKYKPF